MARDFYSVLGVPRGASDKEIRSAFRKLARQYHPDVNPGDAAAEERFKEISEAHSVLSNAETRAAYDRHGDRWRDAEQIEEMRRRGAGGPLRRQPVRLRRRGCPDVRVQRRRRRARWAGRLRRGLRGPLRPRRRGPPRAPRAAARPRHRPPGRGLAPGGIRGHEAHDRAGRRRRPVHRPAAAPAASPEQPATAAAGAAAAAPPGDSR